MMNGQETTMADKDNYMITGELTEGEAKTLIAMLAKCEPSEVRSWVIITHVHADHGCENRIADNCPSKGATMMLMSEGARTLYG